ncbi:L,D-transpeptidase-like protein [Flavobacterium sp. 1]|uniref:murein L,D-transpeptidase catalytic domain-containing protein n=1 Tax=Flavobacterium sp. 1 TaxID=2035200 RepID=UPI000C23A15E|nr:murein L,D-transpeptidase catalytic domain family protein [Flavobacterium sp. 1]PJJ09984.1 L,D-transpeptidase-like protein [Flavobacterium sp. 1]
MKKTIFAFILIGVFSASFSCVHKKNDLQTTKVTEPVYSSEEKLESQISEVKRFVNRDSKYNTEIGFFIDMRITSGKKRFFIYDLKNNKLLDKGLVGHGSGSETGISGKLKFSNTNNSLCTSLGKYSIGNSYNGTFGKAYKLYGLDKTNSNAFDRNVVLHKYSRVPFEEQENDICNSYGCPMVNERFFGAIEKIIDNSKKKIILTIYY